MIYVVGDSHTNIFKNDPEFKIVDIGGATAHNLINEHSTSNSHQKVIDVIKQMSKTCDLLMLALGEIDCRFHIYYQAKKRKSSMESVIDETVQRYGDALFWLLNQAVDPIVLGITPTGYYNRFQEDFPGLPYAQPITLSNIYREFNTKMLKYCDEHGFIYLNIYEKTADDNGFLKKEYAADGVHLNLKALPIIKKLLSNALTGRLT